MDDAPQTAMLLTQEEWTMLASMCTHYLVATRWAARDGEGDSYTQLIRDRRRLAKRIIDAAEV